MYNGNIATSTPITHLLLFDSETPDQAKELINNMAVVQDGLRKAFFGAWHDHYYFTHVVAPAKRSDLAELCRQLGTHLKSQEIDLFFIPVAENDMQLWRGKAGLLTCAFAFIAGCVLLNDSPISLAAATKLPALTRRLESTWGHMALRKKGLLGRGFAFALLRDASSIGHLLLGTRPRLMEDHTLTDLVRVMKSKCGAGEWISA